MAATADPKTSRSHSTPMRTNSGARPRPEAIPGRTRPIAMRSDRPHLGRCDTHETRVTHSPHAQPGTSHPLNSSVVTRPSAVLSTHAASAPAPGPVRPEQSPARPRAERSPSPAPVAVSRASASPQTCRPRTHADPPASAFLDPHPSWHNTRPIATALRHPPGQPRPSSPEV